MRALFALLLTAAGICQEPDLAAARAFEQRRIDLIERCRPAVCSVMDMSAPGGGSGVIFDPRGYVLTNYHVIGAPDTDGKTGKEKVLPAGPDLPEQELAAWREEHWPAGRSHWRNKKVGLPDGELYEAVVLGVDPGSDLATLRLLPKRAGQTWPSCPLGDSDALLVGETVLAMGNPFLLATDFTPTVTFGIVSGTHRYQEGQGNRLLVYPDCIQVDAPINPGNSGGPLFNERGEVVGINGRISLGDRGRVNVGVGFAIASNQVKNFLPDLLAGRHAEHGTLDMSAWFMQKPGGDGRHGVFVQQLFKDSVAALAGVRLGDEILSFDGEEVRSANQMATRIGVLPAGAWVDLGFRSAGADGNPGPEQHVSVRLAPLDTGSGAEARTDGARLASRAERRLATLAMRERAFQSSARTVPMRATSFALAGPDGEEWSCARHSPSDRVRITQSGQVFVQQGRDLPQDEAAAELLRRHLRCNPFLWIGCDFGERMEEALLVGGTHVLGRPAYRYALAGDGELEFFLFADGSPAGFSMRDPVRRQRIELHCRDGRARLILDGAVQPEWCVTHRLADEAARAFAEERPR